VLKFNRIGVFQPITAHDSSQIIEKELKIELNKRIQSLEKQIDSFQYLIVKAKTDLKNTQNAQMKKALKNGINSLNIKQSRLRLIDSLYKYAPEKTMLNKQKLRARLLASNTDSLTGYTLKISFSGKEGLLPESTFERTYVFDRQKKRIMGLMP
jgi:hypothetical protein